jgi:hypothetical protein
MNKMRPGHVLPALNKQKSKKQEQSPLLQQTIGLTNASPSMKDFEDLMGD